MGCHTWFYKECTDSLLDHWKTQYGWITTGDLDESNLSTKQLYRLNDLKELGKRIITGEASNEEIINKSCTLYLEHNGKYYVAAEELPHDVFRTNINCRYSEEVLDSYEATLQFCKKNEIELSKAQRIQ